MNKTKHKVRHISCNMKDFNADCHRFRFEYNGKEYVAACYGALDVHFDETTEREVPETVLNEVKHIIWAKIDKEEKHWRYPQAAYDVANAYVSENFN